MRKALSPSERQAELSRQAAADEGHASVPAAEEDDIEGALVDRASELEAGAAADEAPAKAQQGLPFAAAIEAAVALQARVQQWIQRQRKAGMKPADMLGMTHSGKTPGERQAFAAEVARQLGPAVKARTAQAIFGDNKRQLLEALKAEGFKPITIPGKAVHMREAVADLVRHVDGNRAPSALAAARQRPGLNAAQVRKLANRTAVERAAVDAGICLLPSSLFVTRLRADPGWLAAVVASHKNLAALARMMANAQKSLARAGIRSNRAAPARRGSWHPEAEQLRAAGLSTDQIARGLGQKPDTVKKALKRIAERGGKVSGRG